jgi:hypothetical protein
VLLLLLLRRGLEQHMGRHAIRPKPGHLLQQRKSVWPEPNADLLKVVVSAVGEIATTQRNGHAHVGVLA